MNIRTMTIADYTAVYTLWEKSEGVGLGTADSEADIAAYLKRNEGLSFIAFKAEKLVGAVLCGHDGRRGYINHLAVEPSHRRQGIARALVRHCTAALAEKGIQKCHLFVFNENEMAQTFWERIGWRERTDIIMMSKFLSGD